MTPSLINESNLNWGCFSFRGAPLLRNGIVWMILFMPDAMVGASGVSEVATSAYQSYSPL